MYSEESRNTSFTGLTSLSWLAGSCYRSLSLSGSHRI